MNGSTEAERPRRRRDQSRGGLPGFGFRASGSDHAISLSCNGLTMTGVRFWARPCDFLPRILRARTFVVRSPGRRPPATGVTVQIHKPKRLRHS